MPRIGAQDGDRVGFLSDELDLVSSPCSSNEGVTLLTSSEHSELIGDMDIERKE